MSVTKNPRPVPGGFPGMVSGEKNRGGGFNGGGVGTNFKSLLSSAPHANIQRPQVGMPTRPEFGGPVQAPTIEGPKRPDYGMPSGAGLAQTAHAAKMAETGFNNPTGTDAFKNLMSLANERTGAQESEIARGAKDASQRRGYAGGFEDSAASAQADRMSALAQAGFAGSAQIRGEEGEMYGKSIGAFTQLQDSYNQAKSAGDIAFASDLTKTHMAQAEAQLHALDIGSQQQLSFAGALNDAKKLQAQLDSAYNKDLIDNNRYIEGQQQIASQLMMQREALAAQERAQDKTLGEKRREFDISTGLEREKMSQQGKQFNTSLLANPNTALRALPGRNFKNVLA